jgi:DNA gyrase inhibitor GyrI
MRVASVHGFGESPESQAWDKLIAWAGPKGLLDDVEKHRIFGFDNPNPSPGSPNYGYEFWIVVDPDVEPDGDVRIVGFRGGLYAVARCEGLGNIGRVWQDLVGWREDSKYRGGSHQWLEEHIGPVEASQDPDALVLDLYLPIV